MASSKEYLDFVLEQLSELDGVSFRPMMGEYILYYNGKIVGGVYDNRLLVKPTPAAKELLPEAPLEYPYEGAKQMILVDALDDRLFLERLFKALYLECFAVTFCY